MIIIDVEIKKAVLGHGEQPLPGIFYCNGWRDFANMGISVVCTYDTRTHLSRVFLEEDLLVLSDYLRGKPTAGFNTKRFDIPLLIENGVTGGLGSGGDNIHYDILEQIWVAQGLDPDKFYWRTHGGWGLDAVCQATLGIAKTGHGALALVWWQQGKRGKVIDYCLNDVWMEGQLLLHIIEHGIVTNAAGQTVRVNVPQFVLADALGAQCAQTTSSLEQSKENTRFGQPHFGHEDPDAGLATVEGSEPNLTRPSGLGIVR